MKLTQMYPKIEIYDGVGLENGTPVTWECYRAYILNTVKKPYSVNKPADV